MSSHTPGPWEWVKESGWWELVSESGVIVADDGSAGGEYGFVIEHDSPDGRLISAAPDLLSELQSIVARIDAEGGSPTFHARDLDGARAAIKKALGHE